MRYELMNLYYGHKLIAGSEASKDHFIANAKVDKKTNKPVWVVTKELPDTAPPSKEDALQARIKELEEQLQSQDTIRGNSVDVVIPDGLECTSAPKKKTARKKA